VKPHGQHGGIDPIPGGTRRNPNGRNVFVTIQTSWDPPMEETHDLGGCVVGQPVLNLDGSAVTVL
jgi:hypothetical protein